MLGAPNLIDFMKQAFDAKELRCTTLPDGIMTNHMQSASCYPQCNPSEHITQFPMRGCVRSAITFPQSSPKAAKTHNPGLEMS